MPKGPDSDPSPTLDASSAEQPPELDTGNRWIVLGAGRLGRGVLNLVANNLGFTTHLIVAGRNTSQLQVNQLNSRRSMNDGYRILVYPSATPVQFNNYTCTTIINTDAVITDIGRADTRVLSTSVGLDRLEDIAPVIAAGLCKRATLLDAPRIIILVCENGRQDDRPPSEVLKDHLTAALKKSAPDLALSQVAIVPGVVIDYIVPVLSDTAPIPVGRGHFWIEDLPEPEITAIFAPERFASRDDIVTLTSSNNIALLHTTKLYAYNSLHCIVSILGHFVHKQHVDEIPRSEPLLRDTLDAIVTGLVQAICKRHTIEATTRVGAQTVQSYAESALNSLRWGFGGLSDPIERALQKVKSGWYLTDGRIDGPIMDLELHREPWRCPQLAHTLALTLYHFVQALDDLPRSFAWLPHKHRSAPYNRTWNSIIALEFPPKSFLHGANVTYPLMEVLARDFDELDRRPRDYWTAATLHRFLNAEIHPSLKVVPRAVTDLKCVIFDLDEGLVVTESLLYQVTKELLGPGLTHDVYAQHVGEPEHDFFWTVAPQFNVRTPVRELIQQRETRFCAMLKDIEPYDRLIKPGFRTLLHFLRIRNVKMAVWSNASTTRVEATLARVGLRDYFDDIVTPTSSLQPKPHPSMLTALLDTFNLHPHNCIVIESSLIGVRAALSAGCFCILLVNDYTAPLVSDSVRPDDHTFAALPRRGLEVLPNAWALLNWFRHFYYIPTLGDQ